MSASTITYGFSGVIPSSSCTGRSTRCDGSLLDTKATRARPRPPGTQRVRLKICKGGDVNVNWGPEPEICAEPTPYCQFSSSLGSNFGSFRTSIAMKPSAELLLMEPWNTKVEFAGSTSYAAMTGTLTTP